MLDIVGHLNMRPPEEAEQAYELLIGKMEMLRITPKQCPLVKDTQLRLRGYRTLVIANYTVFLVVSGQNVDIHRIPFSRKQYDWLLHN